MKRVALIAGVLLVLSGCTSSPNATACALYEDAYNDLALAVSTGADADVVNATADGLASKFDDAFERAEGDVAVAIRNSRDLAGLLTSGDADAGTAFFLSTTRVADECAADGAAITLAELDG